jgi:hypothetical protein
VPSGHEGGSQRPGEKNSCGAGVEKYEVEALDSARRFSCWRMQVLTTYGNILEHSLEVPITFPLPRSCVNKPGVWTRKSPSL